MRIPSILGLRLFGNRESWRMQRTDHGIGPQWGPVASCRDTEEKDMTNLFGYDET